MSIAWLIYFSAPLARHRTIRIRSDLDTNSQVTDHLDNPCSSDLLRRYTKLV